MENLSLTTTGVQVHDRIGGGDYGMHTECWDAAQAAHPGVANPFTGSVVAIGPLFAPADQWQCAYVGCEVAAR